MVRVTDPGETDLALDALVDRDEIKEANALAETTLTQGVVTVAANAGGTGTITAGFWFLRDFAGQ